MKIFCSVLFLIVKQGKWRSVQYWVRQSVLIQTNGHTNALEFAVMEFPNRTGKINEVYFFLFAFLCEEYLQNTVFYKVKKREC